MAGWYIDRNRSSRREKTGLRQAKNLHGCAMPCLSSFGHLSLRTIVHFPSTLVRISLEARGSNHIFNHLRKFGLLMHVGRGGTASKTEAMYFPSPRRRYTDENTSNFPVDDTGSISFTESFRYLGSIIHYSLFAHIGC